MKPIERAGYLAHARTRGFARRLDEARTTIREALSRASHPYIAYSTGKDSTCVANLVWEQAPDVPGIYFDAHCAFPESEELLDRMVAAGRPVSRWPCEDFLVTLEKFGGPLADNAILGRATMESTVYEPIRRLLAERHYDGVFLGLRGEESPGRNRCITSHGLLFHQKRDSLWECLPIGHWSDRDVWAYITSAAVDYNRAYDNMEGIPWRERRISYWAGETSRHHGRWAWLRRRYPDLWNQLAARFPEASKFT